MPKSKNQHGEVVAMGMVEKALEPLEPAARGRVLRWAGERYGAPSMPASNVVPIKGSTNSDSGGSGTEPENAGEFYSQAAPETEPKRALVVAYWVQEVQGKGEFDSQTVNTQLKHLGHGVSNITRALDDLKKQKPQLVIQIEKAGKSKQARKRYKVTAAGKTEVKKMLAGTAEA